MDPLSRRRFLGSALAAGAGATLVQPFTGVGAAAGLAAQTGDETDPNFVMGQVVGADEAGYASVLDLDDQLRTVQIASGTRVWKGGRWNREELAPKDCVMGRGTLDGDETLVIDNLWANIRNYRGALQRVREDTVTVRAEDGQLYSASISPDTSVISSDGGQGPDGDVSSLSLGEDAVVIVSADPGTGKLTATRIETFDDRGQVSPEPSGPANALGFNIARRGNASWFCCGNVSGCGRCGASNQGYCSGCRSDRPHIAWPQVSACTAPCVGCCLPSDFPRYGCGTSFDIKNPCSGATDIVYIRDCGPNPRCRSTGCKSYDSVRFDLTPCAFSAVGGSFNIGHCNLWVSPPR